ncbi:MAG TPA: T9SS type A sorting domain-containing protein [Bacteroidia bacterium]|nr:T9SS type A sorting domain-containing protein [Bacteroidia bacterium]
MKKLLIVTLLFLCNLTVQAQSCDNIGFDYGDFTNWNGYMGNNQNSNVALTLKTGPITPPAYINAPATSCDYFSLFNSGTDSISHVTLQSPFGGWCVRMGGVNRNLYGTCHDTLNGATTNSPGEVLERTFTVTPANASMQYAFLFLLADAAHANGQQPYFRVEVLDFNRNPIACLNYYQQGNLGAPPVGYVTDGAGNSYTTAWKINSFNLVPYLNTVVTIRFTVAGCNQGGHFGYAYVDLKCGSSFPNQIFVSPACAGSNATLIAPPQADGTYAWAGPGIVSGANKDTVIVNQPGTYSVTLTNQQGCSYEIDSTINFFPTPTAINVTASSPTTCAGTPVTLNATSTGSAGTLAYTWSPLTNLSNIQDSSATAAVNSTTQYTVTGTSVHGCTNSDTISVIVPNCTGASVAIANTPQATLHIYPNPANNKITIDTKNIDEVKLFDVLGKQITSTKENEIDVSNLPNGIYFIQVKTNTTISTKKIMVQH